MALYMYVCEHCYLKWEDIQPIALRDLPTTLPCPRCQEYEVRRVPARVSFVVKEGACGNASTGYSSTVGDAERFKAKSEGRKSEY